VRSTSTVLSGPGTDGAQFDVLPALSTLRNCTIDAPSIPIAAGFRSTGERHAPPFTDTWYW
jgi:hypothetical protein